MKRQTSGQIALFVVLSVVILILVISIILIKLNYEKDRLEILQLESQIKSDPDIFVNVFFQSCIKRQAEHGLDIIFMQNGVYEKGTATNYPIFPVLLTVDFYKQEYVITDTFNKSTVVPSLKRYLDDTLAYCIVDILDFEEQFRVNFTGRINLSVDYDGGDIKIDMNLPVEIRNLDNEYKMEDFSYTVENVPLELIEKDVNTFVSELHAVAAASKPQEVDDVNFDSLESYLIERVNKEDIKITYVEEFAEIGSKHSGFFIIDYNRGWNDWQVIFGIRDLTYESTAVVWANISANAEVMQNG